MKVDKQRGVADVAKHWSNSQKLEAAKTYLMTGNLAMTSRMLKIPEETVRSWYKLPWWKEMVEDIRTQDELLLSARLKKIVEKTFDVVEDRLEHGDYVFDQKTSKLRRKPVLAKDAAKIGIDFDQKRDKLLNRNAPKASEEQMDEKLNKLAAKFAAIVAGKKDNSDIIVDVTAKEPINALHDQRQA
jgi:hypothetical protein